MFRRVPVLACSLLVLLLTALPGNALAKGAPLRGEQLTTPAWHVGATGECVCDIQWYTVRLKPGTTTVNANLLYVRENEGPSYSLMVWMNYSGLVVGFAKNTCSRATKLCNKHVNFTVKVQHAGVYYLKLKGLGGEGIAYTIRVRGNLSTQPCSKTC